jgi:preprotein translocase subunit SecE
MKKVLKAIFNYFKESKEELSKVTWPTRKQTIEMTIVVIVVVLLVGSYLGGIDYLLTKGLTWLISK